MRTRIRLLLSVVLVVSILGGLVPASGQVVHLDGMAVDLSKIPSNRLGKGFKISETVEETENPSYPNLTTIRVFKSPDAKHIALITTRDCGRCEAAGATILKQFSASGTLLWKLSRQRNVAACTIAVGGNRTYVLWADVWNEIPMLTIHDAAGKLLKTIVGVEDFYTDSKAQTVCYTRGDKKTSVVGCFSYQRPVWEKKVPGEYQLGIMGMSENGHNVVVWDRQTSEVRSWTTKGEELWHRKISGRPGFTAISSDGARLLRTPDIGQLELYDNLKGTLLWRKSTMVVQGKPFEAYMGKFVKGTYFLALASFLGKGQTRIVISDTSGNPIDVIDIDAFYKSNFSVSQVDGETIEIVFDGIRVLRRKASWL